MQKRSKEKETDETNCKDKAQLQYRQLYAVLSHGHGEQNQRFKGEL
jgi:hypothetical protein